MQFMVQLFGKQNSWDADIDAYSAEEFQAMVEHMVAINDDLSRTGELVEARGLGGPSQVTTVRATEGEEPEVTTGPHAAAEEILAGYWVIDVASRERAVEIAARASAVPGRGGRPENCPVELHLLPSGPPR